MTDAAETELPADLRAFVADDPGTEDSRADPADLAYQQLYVEERVLGQVTSRFVGEGGVHFNSVQDYELTPENLPPMASQRRGLADVQLELLKFRFTIDQLPPSRAYTSVSVRITLHPRPTVLMLQPQLDTADTDLEKTSSSEFALEVARLIQVHLAQTHGKTIRRTEQLPVMTALDLGPEGFGWTFEAQEGSPVFPRTVITQAMIEVPRGTTTLSGLFDSEALISRRVLGSPITRPATPANSAAEFTLDLTAPSRGRQP
jgi:hypothetical protein